MEREDEVGQRHGRWCITRIRHECPAVTLTRRFERLDAYPVAESEAVGLLPFRVPRFRHAQGEPGVWPPGLEGGCLAQEAHGIPEVRIGAQLAETSGGESCLEEEQGIAWCSSPSDRGN